MTDKPDSLAAALALVQTMLPRVAKEHTATVTSQRTGRTHTYDYADLHDVSAVLLPILGAAGLAFTARPTLSESGHLVLLYSLYHVSGEEISGEYPLPAGGSPQEIGSAITYARRYALCAVTGLAPAGDDDDATAAEQARPSRQTPAQQSERRSGRVPKDRMTNDQRRDAGLMDRQQAAGHERLAQPPGSRPAGRTRGPDPDDPWAGPLPEDKPGTASREQVRAIWTLFKANGITSEDLAHEGAASILGLETIGSFNDLPAAQAAELIQDLQQSLDAARRES